MNYIFICRKCKHELTIREESIKLVEDYSCPECGEEPELNWILKGRELPTMRAT